MSWLPTSFRCGLVSAHLRGCRSGELNPSLRMRCKDGRNSATQARASSTRYYAKRNPASVMAWNAAAAPFSTPAAVKPVRARLPTKRMLVVSDALFFLHYTGYRATVIREMAPDGYYWVLTHKRNGQIIDWKYRRSRMQFSMPSTIARRPIFRSTSFQVAAAPIQFRCDRLPVSTRLRNRRQFRNHGRKLPVCTNRTFEPGDRAWQRSQRPPQGRNWLNKKSPSNAS